MDIMYSMRIMHDISVMEWTMKWDAGSMWCDPHMSPTPEKI